MKDKVLRLNLYVGLIGFFVSALLLVLKSSFMKTWFFCFAWWSFILFFDSLNFRKRGSSPLSRSCSHFFLLAYLSVFIWIVFELINLRLKNWSYHSLPLHTPERWAGYLVAFASVIPALQELSCFFKEILKGKKLSLFMVKVKPVWLRALVLLGLVSVFLVLLWPQIFFPLPWLFFLFILDPINYNRHNDSLLRGFEKGDWNRFWSWVFAGLVAGILWEMWNFWAGSHWEYSLPYFNFGRVFHMPILGYTGFLPFSLEIFEISIFFSDIKEKLKGKKEVKILILIVLGLSCLVGFYLIDSFTWNSLAT